MARSRRFWSPLRLACVAALGLSLAGQGWTSAPSDSPTARRLEAAPVSMLVEVGACEPGFVEETLSVWLESTKNADFKSAMVAVAFDELVDLVHLLRDIAQDYCV
jgi:hypothetical protein